MRSGKTFQLFAPRFSMVSSHLEKHRGQRNIRARSPAIAGRLHHRFRDRLIPGARLSPDDDSLLPATTIPSLTRHRISRSPRGLLTAACIAWGFLSISTQASDSAAIRNELRLLDSEIQLIKEDVVDVTRQLRQLEAHAQYPRGEQLIVLLSVSADLSGRPGSVSLRLDGDPVQDHVYTRDESTALLEGGVQRLYTGTMAPGRHTLLVSMGMRDDAGESHVEQTRYTLTKRPVPLYMEVHLGRGEHPSKPVLSIRPWTP